MDVGTTAFNGTFYGFEVFSATSSMTLQLAGGIVHIDGLGVAVLADGRVAYLAYRLDEPQGYIAVNAITFNGGAARSLGLQWTASGVALLVNGSVQQTLVPEMFGQATLPPPSLELLDLLANGSSTVVWFDNLCMSSPAAATILRLDSAGRAQPGLRIDRPTALHLNLRRPPLPVPRREH